MFKIKINKLYATDHDLHTIIYNTVIVSEDNALEATPSPTSSFTYSHLVTLAASIFDKLWKCVR